MRRRHGRTQRSSAVLLCTIGLVLTPVALNDEWNLISRTILPIVRQSDIFPGAGPTAVILKQSNGWTRGMLANHIWSFAGDEDRADVDATFLQPFLTYTTPTQWTFGLNTESSYDWENEQCSVPINVSASKLTRFGSQLVSLGGGLRYWAESPESGAEGLGLRVTVTFLFPR